MIYKVGLCGATGRMGLAIAGLLQEGFAVGNDRLELADAVAGSKKIRAIEGVDVRQLSEESREPVHIWIDFSLPAATMKLLEQIDTPVLIGTTGFSDAELTKVRKYAQTHAVLHTSNTSPGMNAFFSILNQLPKRFLEGAHIILREEHHKAKKDSPSGTAKTLNRILDEKGLSPADIQVTRAGKIAGNHSVRFIFGDEELEISHRVQDRQVFARGALQAAIGLLKKEKPGLYKMDEVI